MMLALFRKDLRVYFMPTFGGFLMITMGYAIALSLFFWQKMDHRLWRDLVDSISLTAGVGLMVCVVLSAAFGGSAFSIERREHSADWLGMFPVTRGRIVISKLVAALTCMIALSIYDLLPVILVQYSREEWLWIFLIYLGAQTVLFFLAWAFSTFMESAALSASFAIGILFVVFLLIQGIVHLVSWEKVDYWLWAGGTFVTLASIASFIAGTWYYLNRVEP